MLEIQREIENYHEKCIKDIQRQTEQYRKNRKLLYCYAYQTLNQLLKIAETHAAVRKDLFDFVSIWKLHADLGIISYQESLEEKHFYEKNPAIGFSGEGTEQQRTLMKIIFDCEIENTKNQVTFETFLFTQWIYSRKSYSRKLFHENSAPMTSSHMSLLRTNDKTEHHKRRYREAGLNSKTLLSGIDVVEFSLLDLLTSDSVVKQNWVRKDLMPVVISVTTGGQSDMSKNTGQTRSLSLSDMSKILWLVNVNDATNSPNTVRTSIDDLREQLKNPNPSSISKHFTSLNSVHKYIKGKLRNEETTSSYLSFCVFLNSFRHILFDYYEHRIEELCNEIMSFQLGVINKFIILCRDTNKNAAECINLRENLLHLKADFMKCFSPETSTMKESLTSRLSQYLEEKRDEIIDLEKCGDVLSAVQQSDCIHSNSDFAENSRQFFQDIIVTNVSEIGKEFVDREIFEKYQKFRLVKQNYSRNVTVCNENQSRQHELLHKKLKKSLKLLHKTKSCSEDFINIFYNAIKMSLPKIEIKQSDEEGIEKYAKEFLETFNLNLLAEDSCSILLDYIKMCREEIEKDIDAEIMLYDKCISMESSQRFEIADLTPNFFPWLLRTYNIRCKYNLGEMRQGQRIKRNAYIYQQVRTSREVVAEIFSLEAKTLKRKGEEIYYSSVLSHDRLLPVLGIDMDEDEKKLKIFYPKTKMDLATFLNVNVLTTEMRIKFAKQLAEGIQYLHEKGIMHRDIQLSKLMIDNNNNLYLSGFSSCKDSALHHFSQIGKEIHIAPELHTGALYTNKVDIYSFGIIFWFLFAPPKTKPEGTVLHFGTLFWKGTSPLILKQPERLPNMNEDVWNLMTSCWNSNSNKRPTIKEIMQSLQNL